MIYIYTMYILCMCTYIRLYIRYVCCIYIYVYIYIYIYVKRGYTTIEVLNKKECYKLNLEGIQYDIIDTKHS